MVEPIDEVFFIMIYVAPAQHVWMRNSALTQFNQVIPQRLSSFPYVTVNSLTLVVVKEGAIFTRIHMVHNGNKELLIEFKLVAELGKKLVDAIYEL